MTVAVDITSPKEQTIAFENGAQFISQVPFDTAYACIFCGDNTLEETKVSAAGRSFQLKLVEGAEYQVQLFKNGALVGAIRGEATDLTTRSCYRILHRFM